MTHTRVVAGYRVPRHPALERVAHLARGREDDAEWRQLRVGLGLDLGLGLGVGVGLSLGLGLEDRADGLRVMRTKGRRHLPQPAVVVPAQADGRELDDEVRAAPRAVVHALQQAAQPRLPPPAHGG